MKLKKDLLWFVAADAARAADHRRSIANQLVPPGLSLAECAAAGIELHDHIAAKLLRDQTTMLEGQSALYRMLGWVLAVSMGSQTLLWLFLAWRTWP